MAQRLREFRLSVSNGDMFQATEVAVWVGPAADNSDLAIKRINTGPEEISHGKGFRPIWTSEEGRAIYELCERKYWKRIWIVQEFILAKDITLYCGRKSFSWHALSLIFSHLLGDVVSNRIEHHPYAAHVKTSFAASMVQQRQQKMTTAAFSLCDLIQMYKHMESTDIRDKVFGLLGLVQESELRLLGISANYSMSPSQIYKDFSDAYSFYAHRRGESNRVERFEKALEETLKLASGGPSGEAGIIYFHGNYPRDYGPLRNQVQPIPVEREPLV